MTKKMMIGSISVVVVAIMGAIAFGAYYLTQQNPQINIDESEKIGFTTKFGCCDGAKDDLKNTFITSYEEFQAFANSCDEIRVESENIEDFKVEKNGFVVKGEDSIEFLEEKLEILGLTPRESEEFIVYWLPKLEANKYNYIRFATMEEINRNMPLEISPNPDTLIRLLMVYKGLNEPIEVEEQKLTTPLRKGFVAVEWGGIEIK